MLPHRHPLFTKEELEEIRRDQYYLENIMPIELGLVDPPRKKKKAAATGTTVAVPWFK